MNLARLFASVFTLASLLVLVPVGMGWELTQRELSQSSGRDWKTCHRSVLNLEKLACGCERIGDVVIAELPGAAVVPDDDSEGDEVVFVQTGGSQSCDDSVEEICELDESLDCTRCLKLSTRCPGSLKFWSDSECTVQVREVDVCPKFHSTAIEQPCLSPPDMPPPTCEPAPVPSHDQQVEELLP